MRSRLEILLSKGVRMPNGCLEWPMSKDRLGYGKLWFKKKVRMVHRIVMFLKENVPLEDKYIRVLHKCDNPSCFDPEHLKVGTQRENIRDAMTKGRMIFFEGKRDKKGRFQ
jgi:hypothetical protein